MKNGTNFRGFLATTIFFFLPIVNTALIAQSALNSSPQTFEGSVTPARTHDQIFLGKDGVANDKRNAGDREHHVNTHYNSSVTEIIRSANKAPGASPSNFGMRVMAAPANDHKANATVLTIDANCVSGTTDQATLESGEYLSITPGSGIIPQTVWYRFTATSTSHVLNLVLTNSTNCATVTAIYGPFASVSGVPGAGNLILSQNMGLIDPGFHTLLTGLTVGQIYFIQIQGNDCSGGNDRFSNFCIGVNNPAANV